MTGLNLAQLKRLVIIPALAALPPRLNSPAAVNLLAGTVLAESGATYLHQLGAGPAVGLLEMEPVTHDDCWVNFLSYPAQADIAAAVRGLGLAGTRISGAAQMAGNLYYAVAMARVKYFRAKPPLPPADDAVGLCGYWKAIYNSAGGAGAVDAAHIGLFQQAIAA